MYYLYSKNPQIFGKGEPSTRADFMQSRIWTTIIQTLKRKH